MRFTRFVHILAVTLALSAYAAWLRAERAHRPDVELAHLPAVAGIPQLHLAQAETLWQDSGTVFLDVRSRIDYAYGHIQGALNLPEDERFEEQLPALWPRLEKARAIVVYCKSVDCAKSFWVALRLRNEGLAQTCIYTHGWNEWSLHNLPAARSATR